MYAIIDTAPIVHRAIHVIEHLKKATLSGLPSLGVAFFMLRKKTVGAIAASKHPKSHEIWTKVLQQPLYLGGRTWILLRRKKATLVTRLGTHRAPGSDKILDDNASRRATVVK
jgi:hypothetical protein